MLRTTQGATPFQLPILIFNFGGEDCQNFEPKYGLTFSYLDKIIPKLRAMHKEHPEWFEMPKPKSTKGKNEVEYSA